MLRLVNPGCANAMEITGTTLVFCGNVGGPTYELCTEMRTTDRKQDASDPKPVGSSQELHVDTVSK